MIRGALARALASAALLATPPPAAGHGASEALPAAPEPGLLYALPAAGSYELPPIARLEEHRLLGPEGERAPLLGLAPGQCAVVSFVYLSCADASGCPLSLATLHRFDRALGERPEMRSRVRLVTVSFDPERDRPPQLAALRRHLAPKSDWRFFTAADGDDLAPVLADFGQGVVPLLDAGDEPSGRLRHVTKVFLVDDRGRVRNIYSTGFLDHRILLRDVETLLLEGAAAARP